MREHPAKPVLVTPARVARFSLATVGIRLAFTLACTAMASEKPGQSPVPPGPTDGGLPALPVVSRSQPSQPPVGLLADTHLDKAPPRNTSGLDLVRNGWSYNCMECHKLFPARWHYDTRPFNEHKNIQLEHGNNRFCLNCHHPGNRNSFVDYDGSEIPQADVVKLCAKCHGTIHRDWQAGVHGRQNGFWNSELGSKTRLRCIQCHDPHGPKFQAMTPLPPPKYPARAAYSPAKGKPEGKAAH